MIKRIIRWWKKPLKTEKHKNDITIFLR